MAQKQSLSNHHERSSTLHTQNLVGHAIYINNKNKTVAFFNIMQSKIIYYVFQIFVVATAKSLDEKCHVHTI